MDETYCKSYVMQAVKSGYTETQKDLFSRARIDGIDTLSYMFERAINELIVEEYITWDVNANNGLKPGRNFLSWSNDLEVKVSDSVPSKRSDNDLANYIMSLVKYRLPSIDNQAILDGFNPRKARGMVWNLVDDGYLEFSLDRELLPGSRYTQWNGTLYR